MPAAEVTATDADRNVDYSTVTDTSGPLYPADAAGGALQADGASRRLPTRRPRHRSHWKSSSRRPWISNSGWERSPPPSRCRVQRPLLNTTSATLGQVLENRADHELADQRPKPLSLVAAGAWHHGVDRRHELRLQRSSQQRLRK
mgnify:CR=1 FL=1